MSWFDKERRVLPPSENRAFKCECGGEWFVPAHTSRRVPETNTLRHSEARMCCLNCGAIYTSFSGIRIGGD